MDGLFLREICNGDGHLLPSYWQSLCQGVETLTCSTSHRSMASPNQTSCPEELVPRRMAFWGPFNCNCLLFAEICLAHHAIQRSSADSAYSAVKQAHHHYPCPAHYVPPSLHLSSTHASLCSSRGRQGRPAEPGGAGAASSAGM